MVWHEKNNFSRWKQYNEKIFDYIDLVILDIKACNEKLFETITGTNKLNETLNFLSVCEKRNIPVIVRQVIVPTINDTKENILELKELLNGYTVIKKIELLPYHTLAKDKYKKLNKVYKLNDIKALSNETLEKLNLYLKN